MKTACLIPARLGSKRLPQKNIKLLEEKPLLFWSIDAALDADVFSDICVSTESNEIASIVRQAYSEKKVKILIRPPSLASDTADLNDVCVHYLDNEPSIDFLALFMPTYPFRKPSRLIEEILPPLYSRQIDQVVSVRHGHFSTFDYWQHQDDQTLVRMFTYAPLWCGAGNATYSIKKREYFFLPPHKWPCMLGEKTLRIQTDFKESVDIDTQEDFNIAKKICAGFTPKYLPLKQHEDQFIELLAPAGANIASFRNFLEAKRISIKLPILILQSADPLFTFLRWYECNMTRQYTTELTELLIANLPSSGHSQDFPTHFMHSSHYRVFRKGKDENGLSVDSVPMSQVILEKNLKQHWNDYIDPISWVNSK
jgi:CMP-N-acetylneuraminic acid synthetase